MNDVFDFCEGHLPLLVSVPHDGRKLAPGMPAKMTAAGLTLPDTDWHVAELYEFVRELGAGMIVAHYSRYVVDLNRPSTDEALYEGQVATGLCPGQTFAGEAIYRSGAPDAREMARRVGTYWRPYHDQIERTLAALRARFGYALLWDAHSIASIVPRLFAGELPALNIGTDGGRSCDSGIAAAVVSCAEASPYDSVLNGRFQGGFITRHYGDPDNHVHAVQLEIAQRVYMNEATRTIDAPKTARLRGTLRHMLESFIRTSEQRLSV